jgi:spore coat protein U-like protein
MKQTKTSLLVTSLLAASGFMLSGQALAETDTANLRVTALVNASCTISSATLAFGLLENSGGKVTNDEDAEVDVTVNCTNGLPFKVYSDSTVREMTRVGGTEILAYNLYTDDSYGTALGKNSGEPVIEGIGGTDTFVTIYGRIESGEDVLDGFYSDDVNLTIQY